MKLTKSIEFLDRRIKCEQLAEECAELTRACLKLIRAETHENPCNVTVDKAVDDIVEEISDVEVAMDALIKDIQSSAMVRPDYDIYDRISEIAEKKIARWNQRIEAEWLKEQAESSEQYFDALLKGADAQNRIVSTTKTDTWKVHDDGSVEKVEDEK